MRNVSSLILCVLAATTTADATIRWKGPTYGYWNLVSNWAGGIPITNSSVRLDHDLQTNAYTVAINSFAESDKLWIDSYGSIPVHVLITPSGALELNSFRMGDKEFDRESSFTINGGRLTGMNPADATVTNTSFLIGNNPGCRATFSVVNSGSFFLNGENGLTISSSAESSGKLIIEDSTMQIKESLLVAKGPGANGAMCISGTSSVAIDETLHIAKLENGALMPTGTVCMAQGTLESQTLNIGSYGIGTFNQTNGNTRVRNGGITIGLSNADGQLIMLGGSLQTTNAFLNIGHTDSTGLLSMNDGLIGIDGTISVGSSSRGEGQIDLWGGTLSAKQLFVGSATSATGTVNLYGGELFILGSDNSDAQILNGCIHLQQTLVHWKNSNVTEWVTHAVQNKLLCWSNGLARGTYSSQGFDGSLTNETSILFWDNSDNGSQFSESTIWAEQLLAYDIWINRYQLTPSHALWSADPDHDALDNLAEFGLGGNPTNAFDEEIRPVLHPDTMEYIYRHRSPPAAYGLHYYPELCTDLMKADWSTNGYSITGSSPEIDGFNTITNQISDETPTNLFLRLRIELK